MNKFIKKVDKLRNECLTAISDLYIESSPSIHDYDALGFTIDDPCCRWDEIIWLNGEWQLVEHGTNNLTYPHSLPLQELCSITDGIIEKYRINNQSKS